MNRSISTSAAVAVLAHGHAVCPNCGKRLCDISPDASAAGITLWCKQCKKPVALEFCAKTKYRLEP